MADIESLALAELAAREAGQFLAAGPRRHAVLVHETAHDVKLQADRDAEDRIVDVLTAGSSIPIIAEERAGDTAPQSAGGLSWIVDPLDGTFNYLRGIPFCCVSVALWKDDQPVVGVVYDFDRDEMFSSIVGEGAWVNGVPLRVRNVPPDRAVLCTGFPAATDFAPEALARLVTQIATFRKVRLIGSAALSLAYVAAGRADAYFERDIRVWDVAAGLALVRAAGGEFLSSVSPIDHGLNVYAHNGSCPWPGPSFV